MKMMRVSKSDRKNICIKRKRKSCSRSYATTSRRTAKEISFADVKGIIFACDAGMGSSAMGAGILRNKVKKAEIDVAVTNMAISNLPADAEVVITHKDLTERAKEKAPNAYHISVENFLNSPKYDELIEKLKK